jgi:hypothetical protein
MLKSGIIKHQIVIPPFYVTMAKFLVHMASSSGLHIFNLQEINILFLNLHFSSMIFQGPWEGYGLQGCLSTHYMHTYR